MNFKKDEKYPKQIWNCFFVIFNKKKTLFVFVVIIFDEDQVSAVCDSDLLNCDLVPLVYLTYRPGTMNKTNLCTSNCLMENNNAIVMKK
jgi:hypothetical protein